MAKLFDRGKESSQGRKSGALSRASPRRASLHGFDSPFRWLQDEFDRRFEQLFSGWPSGTNGGNGRERFWGLDVQEKDDSVVVSAEAPGFEPSDFELEVRGDQYLAESAMARRRASLVV